MANSGEMTGGRFAAESFVDAYHALDTFADRGEGVALLHGAAGCGKTHLLREIAERHTRCRTVAYLYRGSQLSGTPHGEADLLLVDEADDMRAPDIAELRRRRDAHALTVIASTRSDLADILDLGPVDAVVELSAFSDADARAFAVDLANWPFSAAALDILVDAAGGSPRRIRSLVNVAGLEAELQESAEVDAGILAAAVKQLTFFEGAKTGQAGRQGERPPARKEAIARDRPADSVSVEGRGRIFAALPRGADADRAAGSEDAAPEKAAPKPAALEAAGIEVRVPEAAALTEPQAAPATATAAGAQTAHIPAADASPSIGPALSKEWKSQRAHSLEDSDDAKDWQPDVNRWRPWQRVVAIGGSMLAGTAAAVLALMATGSPPFAAPQGLAAIFGADAPRTASGGDVAPEAGATTLARDETLAGLTLDADDEDGFEPTVAPAGKERVLAEREEAVPAPRAVPGGGDRARSAAENVPRSVAAGDVLAKVEPSSRPAEFDTAPSAELAMNERTAPLSLRVPTVSVGRAAAVAMPAAATETDVAAEDLRLAEESRRTKDRIRSLRY